MNDSFQTPPRQAAVADQRTPLAPQQRAQAAQQAPAQVARELFAPATPDNQPIRRREGVENAPGRPNRAIRMTGARVPVRALNFRGSVKRATPGGCCHQDMKKSRDDHQGPDGGVGIMVPAVS